MPQRAGGPWPRTRRTAPERAARRGWAVAVAPWGWVRVGGEADETLPARPLLDVPALGPRRPRTRRATRRRLVRGCRQGWVALVVAVRRQEPWPEGRCVPAPWPAVPAWQDETDEPQRALPEAA
jgi:hypothetical protein